MMIARIWHGTTPAELAEEYTDYVRKTGIEELVRTEGNRASMILRRVQDGEAEFLVISLWESMEDVRAFAGDRPDTAVYYREDEAYLLELEPEVAHYELPVCELRASNRSR